MAARVESLRQALEITAQRGLPMKAGMFVLTGAITGVHKAKIGDEAVLSCAGTTPIACRLVGYS